MLRDESELHIASLANWPRPFYSASVKPAATHLVLRELLTGRDVEAAFVDVELGLARSILDEDFADGLDVRILDVERANLAAAFDERDDGTLGRM